MAPTSTTIPSSTDGSRASCWLLVNRWISSMKSTVRRPSSLETVLAAASTSRTSLTPAEVAERTSKTRCSAPPPAAPALSSRSQADPRGSSKAGDPTRPGGGRRHQAEQRRLADHLVEGFEGASAPPTVPPPFSGLRAARRTGRPWGKASGGWWSASHAAGLHHDAGVGQVVEPVLLEEVDELGESAPGCTHTPMCPSASA